MENQLQLSTSSFLESLESQKELFRRQIDQLQNIVLTQCNLTGVNPLSQEMAAGALSIKIGKRPRDLLNPKAIKYMQSIFSIKDAISKKESREISALYGVTATQVREFFTSQRSRVRKFVRLSKEKETRSNACNEANNEPSCSDPNIPIDQVPLNSIGPTSAEGHHLNAPDEVLPGIDDSDKHFVQNIFSLMRKEETFSGQEKLMEWILQIQNPSVLCWFLTKGGVMILATWLSQAAGEEQTSVLHVILKVLCHLPLHKALPVHMSAILQSVNKLRFYRTADISNRARVLLSRWSKIFARSQAMRKTNVMKSSSDAQDEMLLKQSIGEIMENESWESKADIPEGTSIPLLDNSDNSRKFESPQPLKLLTSADDSNKKLIRGVSSSQNRERRKVMLVEQPGQKTAGRNQASARSAQPTQSRPLSADDIQKAKMRAQFMRDKYGKASTSTDVKAQGLNACSSSQASTLLSTTKANVRPRVEEHKRPVVKPALKVGNQEEAIPPLVNKKSLEPEEPPLKKLKRVQVPWQTPPEIRISGDWTVGNGENSKEVEIQRNRIRREKEIMYRTVAEIPPDPNEPWDREMDYDDTLTPVIPTDQLPDLDGAETPAVSPHKVEETAVSSVTCTATTSSQSSNGNVPEPDLELLAVLLKNPELVMALTSGQGGSLSSEETVKLLDMIKTNGSVVSSLNGKPEENVEVSLPSPTPSSNTTTVTGGLRQEFAKNPFTRQNATAPIATTYLQEKPVAAPTRLVQPPQTPMVAPHQPPTIPQPIPQLSLPQKTTPPVIRSSFSPPNRQTSPPENVLNMNNFSHSSLPLPNLSAAASPSRRAEAIGNTRLAPVTMNASHRPQAPFHLPALTQQNRPIPEPTTQSWGARQGMALNTHPRDNYNNYNPFVGGPVLSGPPRERDEFMGESEFESWSPDNSPVRSTGRYMPGWNYAEPRTNFGQNFRPDRSRYRNHPPPPPPPPMYRDTIGRRGRDYDQRR